MARAGTQRGVTIIRRNEVVEGGHHGGAWKVAYADFVTAMMAFFLLMWLLNATTEKQRTGIADYFAPSNALSRGSSGVGKPFGGKTPFEHGPEVSDTGIQAVVRGKAPDQPDTESTNPDYPGSTALSDTDAEGGRQDDGKPGEDAPASGKAKQTGEKLTGGGQATAASLVPARADFLAQAASGSARPLDPKATDPVAMAREAEARAAAKREEAALSDAAEAIRSAVGADPALAELARQISIDVTPEGLRVQILDADRTPMFATGSAEPNAGARLVLAKIAPLLSRLAQPISIAGHTDAAPYQGGERTNWELSADRANATRRLLEQSGVGEARFRSVTGNADRDPLLPADPLAAANRRIAILVLRTQPKSR